MFAALLLAGCAQLTVLFPSGDVAEQQRDMLVASVVLMLLIIVPVCVATAVIAYRYRESNLKSSYAPDWEHSTKLELLIWAAPLAIIITLGAMTWIGTHLLDPYSPLTRIDDHIPLPQNAEPLRVDVVALNWKWLFLYPDYGIATVGEVAAPVDVPINFRITATDIMNSFYIPALAGQIYAMPGMQTQLNAVINAVGTYKGISANYSGRGFNYMDFRFLGMTAADFEQWVATIKSGNANLSRAHYRELAQPSVDVPVQYYADYVDGLFRAIVLECFSGSAACESEHPMHGASIAHKTASKAGGPPSPPTH